MKNSCPTCHARSTDVCIATTCGLSNRGWGMHFASSPTCQPCRDTWHARMSAAPQERRRLLPTSSPLYLRRLAREINAREAAHGAYYTGRRIQHAKISKGLLLVRLAGETDYIAATDVDAIYDGFGRQITARREKRS